MKRKDRASVESREGEEESESENERVRKRKKERRKGRRLGEEARAAAERQRTEDERKTV